MFWYALFLSKFNSLYVVLSYENLIAFPIMVIMLFYIFFISYQIHTFKNNLNDEEILLDVICGLHYKKHFSW